MQHRFFCPATNPANTRRAHGALAPRSVTVALLCVMLCATWLVPAQGGEPSATVLLSDTHTEVGQPVQLQVKITDGDADPPEIRVDGLQIEYRGPSRQNSFNFVNGALSRSSAVAHLYAVTPLRAGRFTIPALTLKVDGKTLTTSPVTLEVGGGGAGGGGSTKGDSAQAFAFGEIVLPPGPVYVGETVPVELRFYVDSRVHWQVQQPPLLSGDGFATQKMSEARQTTVTRNGRQFDLVTYRTAITAAKGGIIELGPADLGALAQLPRSRPRRERLPSPFDDFFDDSIFDDFFSSLPVPQSITLRTNSAQLEVKPLPPGAPASFAGAVGEFKIEAKADPPTVKVGDPVTLKLTVSGRGNFDRVAAPRIADTPGWRSYPPAETFHPDDDLGLSGRKEFAVALIPSEVQNALPPAEFTFFDPVAEKYVTLRTKPLPIMVTGAPAPPIAQNSPLPAPPALPAPTASPAPQSSASGGDILYIRTDPGRWGVTFEPLYTQRGFFLFHGAVLLLLLGWVGFAIAQARASDSRARAQAALRAEKARLHETLNRRDVSLHDFYDAAVRCLQIEAALRLGRDPASIVVAEAASLPGLDQETIQDVRRIFAARDELLYSGRGGGNSAVDAATRERVLRTFHQLEAAHA